MSSHNDKENVFPTRTTLSLYKSKLIGAKTGHSLLKKKSESLTNKFRDVKVKIEEAKKKMGNIMKLSSFSVTELRYATDTKIDYHVKKESQMARIKVGVNYETISGIHIPFFDCIINNKIDNFRLTGLGKGGQEIQNVKMMYSNAVEMLIDLASLQSSLIILDRVIKIANRRVNAINHIIVPRTENTINYILSELEELDRDEFYRLKKVQENKLIEQQKIEKEQKQDMKQNFQNDYGQNKSPDTLKNDLKNQKIKMDLNDHSDEDVIF